MTGHIPDHEALALASRLAVRAMPLSRPNPPVGALLVKGGQIIGRGWTAAGGRPHAEAIALAMAGGGAKGATLFTTLEPCAHHSSRGPSCADLIATSGIARLVYALVDPDPRTSGEGAARVASAGIAVDHIATAEAEVSLEGYLMQRRAGRPFVTLKLALSLDGQIAMADGTSRWITGPDARRHAHLIRAMSDAILVGRGTFEADDPQLDVRLAGLEARSPARWLLSSSGNAPDGWQVIASPAAISHMADVQHLLVEGGAATAAAFVKADLVDRLMIYRSPVLIGAGRAAIGDIGLATLDAAHGRWRLSGRRALGSDDLAVYERVRK